MSTTRICPSCGKALEANAPRGLCPECLLKAGFPSGPEASEQKHSFEPLNTEELAAKLPQLEILGLVGRGGMGAVYKARQKELDRVVALKILPPAIGREPGFADRFAREAKALARLNHPNIVTLYEFAQADGLFYFIMEYVDGMNLRELLQAGRLAPREALAIVPQICDALQYAHDQGIVHRDIKPENILLDRKGRVKVADFGLARLMGLGSTIAPVLAHQSAHGAASSVSLTEAGKVMGTPQYMAPEQKERPAEVDHRADIYSLGVVFYHMLTGELPDRKIEPPSKKVILDVRLDEVVMRALEKEPERRYQQASQIKTQIETIAESASAGAEHLQTLQAALPIWRIALAAATTSFFAIAVCGLTLGKLLHLPSQVGFGLTMVLAVAGGILSLWFVVRTLEQWQQAVRSGRDIPSWQWFRFLAVIAWVTALPAIGFGVFFLRALASDRSWHPAFDEAIAVPLTWLGSILLPICGWILIRAPHRARARGEMREALWPRRVVVPITLLMLAPLGGAMILFELIRATRAEQARKEALAAAKAAAAAASQTNATNQQQFFFVHGRVTDEQGNGLPGVTVAANCGAGTLRRTGEAQTDDNGSYRLRFGPGMWIKEETTGKWGVGVQAATIHPAKNGYFDANLNRQGDLLMADRLPATNENVGWKVDTNKLVLPGQPFLLNFVMLPAAAIEGELRDEKDAPVPGWAVCLSGENLPPSSSVFACVDTDANGRFALGNAPTTGRWWLEAYRHADRKRNLPAGAEFRSERFTLGEPGKYHFNAQVEEADPQHRLKIQSTGPERVKNTP